jgi:serine phosphatase RsbU (regulator of sigma subunit)
LSKFNPDKKVFTLYTAADGLQGNEFSQNSNAKLKNGEMVFGGLNGINIFHPDSLKSNPFIPPVVFTDFQIFNKSVGIGDKGSPLKEHIAFTNELTLSYRKSVFSFEFAALNYLTSENNQFAYKLEGFEKNWNFVGNERKATYTNIDPGDYIFKVKASNNDGVWNEEGIAVKITITPPFWKTWWFKTLIAVVVIGGAVSYYKIRMSVVKAQKAELEKQVKERTAEVVQQKEELQAQAENLQVANHELHEKQEEILQQTEEILQQRELLEAQRDSLEITNNKVMSSINYAKTIQKAILPADSKIKKFVQEHFVIYRPKDIVSGDFYWFTNIPKEELADQQRADISFFATIDCTGHGVPGAFMSIIGNTLLNEIVNIKGIHDPAQILEALDKGVRKLVDKSDGVNTAGMDVCLISVEKIANDQVKILFAGAKRPLHYIKNGTEIIETLEGDRRSIGSESKVEKPFTTKEIIAACGVTLYLSSDGYSDQNNPAREKMGSVRFKALLKEAFNNPLALQKAFLEKALDDHQKDAEQRDDIALFGVKI